MRGLLNKQEALAILREVAVVLSESVVISGVSLDPLGSTVSKDPNNVGFLIRMKCDLDNYTQDYLKSLLEKHKLSMKEENGYVLIFPC
jgi:hypothetical protein